MSIHLFRCRLCLHIKRIWDGTDYRPTAVVRTRSAEIRVRIVPPALMFRRFPFHSQRSRP